ncbi:hypothetical protein NLY50_10530 [Bacillus sp. RP12]|nr:hypothetical protein [Bacillus sp. RP12]
MNMKKAILTIPLSAALLFPAAHNASAHEGHMHGEAKKTSSSQEVSNKATDLRAAPDQLFSEHAYLAVITMQKGIDGSKDFDQATAALNDNMHDLSKKSHMRFRVCFYTASQFNHVYRDI